LIGGLGNLIYRILSASIATRVHGASFLRWRSDRAPRQCTFRQVSPESAGSLALLAQAAVAPAAKRRG